jgi:hypothetical protein
MENQPKLFLFLRQCTGYELRRFRVFLASPYFNQRPELCRTWDFLRPLTPAFDAGLPRPTDLYEAAWPGEAFSPTKYRHLLSALTELLQEFWALRMLESRPELQAQLQLHSLDLHHLPQAFAQTLTEAQTRMEAQPLRDFTYLRSQLDLARAAHNFQASRENRAVNTGLDAVISALDAEYIANKLRIAAAALNRANVLGESAEIALLPEILAFIDAQPENQSPLIAAYRLVLQTLQAPKAHEAFSELLRLLASADAQLGAASIAELYTFALNYCIRMVNLGESDFDAQLFALFQLLLERGYLREDGALPVQHFKNFVTLGLRLGHIEAVEQQMRSLTPQLLPDIRANSILFSEASLAFHRGDYRRALRMLRDVEFTDVYYHLDAKSLLLKVWYELGEVEPLLSLVQTFKIYLQRNRKISDYQRQTYRNQVVLVHQMTQYRLGSRKQLSEIAEEMERCGAVADRPWLERKLKALN